VSNYLVELSSVPPPPTRGPRVLHQQLHQPERSGFFGITRDGRRRRILTFPSASHLLWGRVVPDIPDFCRELIAALAEGQSRTGT
jgi:hypothetical protein